MRRRRGRLGHGKIVDHDAARETRCRRINLEFGDRKVAESREGRGRLLADISKRRRREGRASDLMSGRVVGDQGERVRTGPEGAEQKAVQREGGARRSGNGTSRSRRRGARRIRPLQDVDAGIVRDDGNAGSAGDLEIGSGQIRRGVDRIVLEVQNHGMHRRRGAADVAFVDTSGDHSPGQHRHVVIDQHAERTERAVTVGIRRGVIERQNDVVLAVARHMIQRILQDHVERRRCRRPTR